MQFIRNRVDREFRPGNDEFRVRDYGEAHRAVGMFERQQVARGQQEETAEAEKAEDAGTVPSEITHERCDVVIFTVSPRASLKSVTDLRDDRS